MKKLILRSEFKKNERRTPLTPDNARQLVDRGIEISVEETNDRIFPMSDYAAVGCKISKPKSWKEASPETVVLGLKELPIDGEPLKHQHIYFAHIYKGQEGCEKVFEQYHAGQGSLYDLEYLANTNGRRVAAFGYWAGYVGAAKSLKSYFEIKNDIAISPVKMFSNQEELIRDISSARLEYSDTVKAIIIGAKGRCGQGAIDLLEKFNVSITKWDMAETKSGGPFKDIMDHHLFINAVLIQSKIPPFLNKEMIKDNNILTVIGDVSCDPNSDLNPIPLYNKTTTWNSPLTNISESKTDLKILAVDNLPSVLPLESSIDFSNQLIPHLENFLLNENDQTPWESATEVFKRFVK